MSDGDQSLFESHVGALEDWVIPIYVPSGQNITVPDLMSKAVSEDFQELSRIFVARIDNDDAIDRSFFSKLYRLVDSSTQETDHYIIFKYGTRWDGNFIENLTLKNNPFLTVYSPNWHASKPNPMAMNHSAVLDQPHIFAPSGEPMWLQSIHGANVLNDFTHKAKKTLVRFADISEKYGVLPSALDAIKKNCDWVASRPG